MKDWVAALLIMLGVAAGAGVVGVLVLRSRGSPRGTLTLANDSEPQAEDQRGVENYSEMTWTDALGNERKLVSHRRISGV